MPTVTLALLIVAVIGNWRTPRRRLLLGAVALFIVAVRRFAILPDRISD